MRRRILTLITLILLFCLGAVACNKKTVQKESEKDIYSEPVLLNGFDTTADMYKVRQHTYVKNNKWTGYSVEGKLQIVGKEDFIPVERDYPAVDVHKEEDMAPRQGDGALYVNYVSEIAEAGGFTQMIARFENTDFKDLPVERLSGISVQVYNDNSQERKVTLSLVKSDLSVVSFGQESAVVLAPYSWTECFVELNPAVVEYFSKDIIGLSVEFNGKTDSVYYLDNLCLTFEPVYTDEINEYLNLVKELEADIQKKVVGKTISLETKEDLTNLFARYLALPEEYQGIVSNYTDLQTAISKYLSLVHEEEFKATGEAALLRFDEIFGLTQITDTVGCSVSYTTEEHAPGEEGAICVEFDGTETWAELLVSPSGVTYDETRVWVKNDSEFARIVQLTWKTLAATGGSAYDEKGNEITNDLKGVEHNNNIIGKGGWIQLVWRDTIDMASIQFSSYDTEVYEVLKSQGRLYIGKVVTVSEVGELMKRIDAIQEKDSYTEKELVEIFDVKYAILNLSKELKNALGLDRTEKIERIYQTNADKVLNAKIKTLKVKDEYSAKEIKEIEAVAALYEELSKEDKQNVSTSNLSRVQKKIENHNKKGTNMDVTAYDSFYEEALFYSTKETYSGAAFSMKYEQQITNGGHVSVTFPEIISGAKKLKIAIKNTSDKDIAFWPKVVDEQGGTWMESKNHGVVITKDEGWIELTYDIEGLKIESFVATYGPWESGELSFYIGKIEVVTDLSKEVQSEISSLSSLFDNQEFTASEIRRILDVKEMYDALSAAEKKKIDVTKLNVVIQKLSRYNIAGDNMNVVAYDVQYGNVLSYSLKDVLTGEQFSMRITSNITNKDAITVSMPKSMNGRKLTVTVKNTSDKDIAFWPAGTDAEGGTWLNPSNHSGDPIIKADEGWVELTYDITGVTIDAWATTYGPWENGELSIYIGKITVTDSVLSDVAKELDSIQDLVNQDEYTATEIKQILAIKSMYDELPEADRKHLDVTTLNGLLEKIKGHDAAGVNKNVVKYDSEYGDILFYSTKEKVEGESFSLKLDSEVGAGEMYLTLPETIYGAKILRITVKNTSDQAIAFWPSLTEAQGGTWLNPTNHGASPEITAAEGWVELEYDINGMTLDALVATYGPWMSGQMELYIGKIEVETTYLEVVKAAIDSISDIIAKDEFTAAEMKKILNVKEIYDSKLTEAEKQNLDATSLLAAVAKIEGYDTAGSNVNVTKYDSTYGDILYYSTKEKIDGSAFSMKWAQQTGTGEAYVMLPESINGAKELTITVKNTSDKDIAFWPKVADVQGAAWLNPLNHDGSPVITAAEGWVELSYNVDGMTIDSLVATYGPWESGRMELYIGKMEVVTTYYPVVKEAFDQVADILNQDEFTAIQIEQIMNVKMMYDSMLTAEEQQTLEADNLLAAVEKMEGYDAAGNNMNVAKYDSTYGDILYHSAKEKVDGSTFSVKWAQQTGTGEAYVALPEEISGAATLTITVKNTSAKDIAFWPKLADAQGGIWLNPTNHDGSPIITAAEGWVKLTYDIEGKNIDELVATYGPWESGQLEIYIGNILTSEESTSTLTQFSIAGTTGSSYTQTAEGIKVDFDGSTTWCDINFATVEASKEIHVFIKNDSEYSRIVSLDWAAATKVLNENGEDITDSVVFFGTNTVIPANSDWLEVIYTATTAGQFNCISLDSAGEPINSVGSLYIKGYETE